MGNLIKIFVAENSFEADLITQALRGEGIPVLLKRFSDTAYDGLYIPQKGWAAVMIPEQWKALGEEVVAEFEDAFRKRREADDRGRK